MDAGGEILGGNGQQAPVFVLSSERAGSTLLRNMLSGHPDLFCLPESTLLCFDTINELRLILSDAQQLEFDRVLTRLGLSYNNDSVSMAQVYKDIQQRLPDCRVVDKSPLYGRDRSALARAENWFDGQARYVYLSRHPVAVIESYARMLADRTSSSRHGDPIRLGESGWTQSNRTIRWFLEGIESNRWIHVYYEDLVRDSQRELERVSGLVGVSFESSMLDPYQFGAATSVTVSSGLVGDPNFNKRSRIDPELGDVWKRIELPMSLGQEASRVAYELGYRIDNQAIC